MRSNLFVPILAGAVAAQAQGGIDFDAVFSGQPALRNLKPTRSTPINRAASASSVISRMNAVKPNPTPTAAAVRTTKASVTGKPKTTAKKTLPKLKTTQKLPKKAFNQAIKKAAKKQTKKQTKKSTKKQAKKGKRAAIKDAVCGPQDIQFNYTSSPNTPTGFLVDTILANTAGLIPPPAGYTKSFLNAFGSVNADGYVGYYQLPSYSVQACADICTNVGDACQSFNIYFERNPTVDPDADKCPNPNAATSVRCALWGSKINSTQAVNIGQWRASFMTVVSGSNGYSKNPLPALVSGFNASQALAGFVNPNSRAALSTTFIAGTGYNPAACGQLCTQWNTNSLSNALQSGLSAFSPCNYFNAAILSDNGVPVSGTYCSLFSGTDVGSFANLFTSTANSGASYDISSSYGYAIASPVNGSVPVSSTTSVATSAAPTSTVVPGSCAALGNNKTASAAGGRTYELHCATDFTAGDIAAKPAANLTACMALCDATDCNAAVYASGAAYCYMKNLAGTKGTPSTNTAVDFLFVVGGPYTWGAAASATQTSTSTSSTVAATAASATGTGVSCASLNSTTYLYPGTTRRWELHCGYDLAASGDLGGVQVKSFPDCVNACNNNTQCNGAVYTGKASSGYCYIKSINGTLQKAKLGSTQDLFIDPSVWTFKTSS